MDSLLGVFGVSGQGLSHLFIALVYRRCRDISPTAHKPALVFDWTVASVGIVPRLPKKAGLIDPYEGGNLRGWMLFETRQFWHLFPVDHLLGFGYRTSWLYLVFADKVVKLLMTPATAKNEFLDLIADHDRERYYTTRNDQEYLCANPGLRSQVRDIEVKDLGSGGISGFSLTKFYPLKPGSGVALSIKRPSVSISGP